MSRTPTADDWQTLYRQAILEPDPAKLPGMIDLAYTVIQRRAFELWYAGAPASGERNELDAALDFLNLLRTLGRVHSAGSESEISTTAR
jgi:hypothetical protein